MATTSESGREGTEEEMGTRSGPRHFAGARARTAMVIAAGCAALLGWSWLAARSGGKVDVWQLLAVLGIGWGALAVAVRARAGLTVVCVFAVLFRLAGFFATPVFEDDWARYLWDGFVFAERGSPYGLAPENVDPSGIPVMEDVHARVNHPHLPTIYGPVAEGGFLFSYLMAPGRLWPLRLLLLHADLLVLALVARRGGARAALLYGWCPLVVQEIAFNVHVDAWGMAMLFGAWVALDAKDANDAKGATRATRDLVGGALAGAATAVKVLAAPGVTLLLAVGGVRGTSASWRARVACGVTLALCYLPFVMWLGGDAGAFSLGVFAGTWRFNPLLFAPLAALIGDVAARAVGAVVVAGCIAVLAAFAREKAGPRAIAAAYGVLLLFAPVVNPWYLLWAAPFVAMAPSATGIAALLAVGLSYATGANLGRDDLDPFAVAGWARVAEAAILLAGIAIDVRREQPGPGAGAGPGAEAEGAGRARCDGRLGTDPP